MKTRALGYWTATAIVAACLVFGGAMNLTHVPQMVELLTKLGYPPYIASILGVWKLLGGAVLLAPGLPRLKEWAYAGAIFDFTGAGASYLLTGQDIIPHAIWPLAMATVALASWALRPSTRILGALAPAAGGH